MSNVNIETIPPAPEPTVRLATTSPWHVYYTDDGTVVDFEGSDVSATLAETLVAAAPKVLRIVDQGA